MNNVEIEAAEALLDIGISFPVAQWHIPFTQRHFSLRYTMRRPTFGARIRIAREYLSMGVREEEMKEWNKEEQMAFMATHGKAVSRVVSYSLVHNKLLLWTIPLVAWWLRWCCDERLLSLVFLQFIRCLGTQDFMNIIASVERTNPLTPMTSQ